MPDPCPSPEIMSEYLLGRIDPVDGDRIDLHLDHCQACQTVLTSYQSEEDTVVASLRLGLAEDVFEQEPELQASLKSVKNKRVREPGGSLEQTQLGPYRLMKLLGKGGMGEVYSAQHTRLEKMVAVKVLAERLLNDPRAVTRFDREMKAVGQLDHPNIVRASDAGEINGKHFLVMELITGEDLSVIAQRRGPLTIADACEVVRQAAMGLQHAFDNGLVHRDIKPANLILNPQGCVKILDMGLALLATSFGGDTAGGDGGLTTEGQMMGTVDYMAPEQISDSHKVGIRADIYALGCTIYRLLAGAAPFQDLQYPNAFAKARAHCEMRPPPLSERRKGLPKALVAIVEKMLAKNPSDRWQSPAELAAALVPFTVGHDLPALLKGLPTATQSSADFEAPTSAYLAGALPASAAESSRRKPTRKKLIIGLGFCGGLLAIFTLIMFLKVPAGTLRIEINDPAIELTVKGTQFVLRGAEQQDITLTPGEHSLHIQRGDFEFDTKSFQLSKGEVVVVKVEWVDGMIKVASNGEPLDFKSLSSDASLQARQIAEPTGSSNVSSPKSSPVDSNLALAQWALANHGQVIARINNRDVDFHNPSQIPDEPFVVTGINFTKTLVPSDSDLETLSQSSTLSHLEFSDLELSDRVMKKLTLLPQLTSLRLRYNEAPPQGLERLAELPHLFDLTVGGEYVGDEEIAMLKGIKNAARVTIGGKQVTDAGLVHLADMTHLEFVSLIFTRVQGSGLVHLTNQPKLWSLQTPYSPLNDSAAESLSQMKAVTWLNLAFTQVGDESLKRIVAMPKLEDLDLTQTQITNAGIAFLQPSTSLRRLHVAAPRIDDGALEVLSKLTQLTFLSVGGRMSAEAVETLRMRLPNCQIHSD